MTFGATVKMATTLKIVVRAAKNVETQLKEKGVERAEVRENRKFEGSSRSKKKNRCPSPTPTTRGMG